MRKIVFICTVLVFTQVARTFAASAVACNKATGSYGFCFGKKSVEEAKKIALEKCPGGEIIASSSKDGFGAILRTVNNWKTEGQKIEVVAILSYSIPIGVRKPGTGECPSCQIVELWNDNAGSSEVDKREGSGSGRAPEVLKPTVNIKDFDGNFVDQTIIDGREFTNGYSIDYLSETAKTVMQYKTEYYMGLPDGLLIDYNYVEGQPEVIEREYLYKNGMKRYERKFGPTGAVEEYIEYSDAFNPSGYQMRDGVNYKYDYKGNLKEVKGYKNDNEHGLNLVYNSKGVLEEQGRYEFGKKEGEWITYMPDGKTIKKKKNYAKGIALD